LHPETIFIQVMLCYYGLAAQTEITSDGSENKIAG
jgi:hypothetical protein